VRIGRRIATLRQAGCLPHETTQSQFAHSPVISKVLPNASQRHWLIAMPAAWLIIAFGVGRFQGSDVANFSLYFGKYQRAFSLLQVVDLDRSGLPLRESCDQPVLYLGLLGSTYFFYEKKTMEVASFERRGDRGLFFRSSSKWAELACPPKVSPKTQPQLERAPRSGM
jgi:hypothetical protein